MSQSTTAGQPAGVRETAEASTSQPPLVEERPLTPADVSGALEALLLVAEEPRRSDDLAAALGAPEPVVRQALAELVRFYDETGRGFELREVGGGWRYWTREEHADLIAATVLEGQQARLSQAALETLAVIAYTQPISRGRVSAVRGVNVDGVIRTLLARGLVEEAGQDVDSGAVVFATTSHFLERMGLRSLDDLPALAPHLPEASALEAELGQLAAGSAPAATPPDDNAPEEPSGATAGTTHDRTEDSQ
ncbi:condensin subunit ScpB [Friedmanniella luteola]|uniref:Condensin subunit ScpB n=1 Tax=Friedmanniella luteola TaxID=546871 RepID=A0A1H1QVZ6_9ACTN|nr:SMC-Scp complex subunit ScpB [Friedmanniella luteola]SDS27624.1 condensin subunit ScpB [Friedmanniella luteola]